MQRCCYYLHQEYITEEAEYPTSLWACGPVLQPFTEVMTFVMIFTYKVVSQIVLQHHIAAASTCISALQYMRFSYMPTNG